VPLINPTGSVVLLLPNHIINIKLLSYSIKKNSNKLKYFIYSKNKALSGTRPSFLYDIFLRFLKALQKFASHPLVKRCCCRYYCCK